MNPFDHSNEGDLPGLTCHGCTTQNRPFWSWFLFGPFPRVRRGRCTGGTGSWSHQLERQTSRAGRSRSQSACTEFIVLDRNGPSHHRSSPWRRHHYICTGCPRSYNACLCCFVGIIMYIGINCCVYFLNHRMETKANFHLVVNTQLLQTIEWNSCLWSIYYISGGISPREAPQKQLTWGTRWVETVSCWHRTLLGLRWSSPSILICHAPEKYKMH